MSVLRRPMAFLALAGLFVLATSSQAQPPQPPQPPGNPPAQNATPVRPPNIPPVNPAAMNPAMNPAAQTGTLSSPYLGGPTTYPVVGSMTSQGMGGMGGFGGGYPYFPTFIPPYAGALFGVAAVTTANAQYQLIIQQARLQSQYANQAGLDTRRRLFDQIRYERMFMPTPEDIRTAEMATTLKRSRNNPPPVEIYSGDALNSLLDHLKKMEGMGVRGPMQAIDDDVLKRINVTAGNGGNVGLLKDLKDGGKLQWPLALQRPDFAKVREILDTLFTEAVQQVKFGNEVKVNIKKDIQAALQLLNEKLNQLNNEMSIAESIEARRYVNQLNAAFKALDDTQVASFFNGKFAAQGKTVGDLVKYMAANGLIFAPATQGDFAAYKALQGAMAAYADNVDQLANRP